MKGFDYALNGIREAFATQINFRFHIVAIILVVAAGFFLELSGAEWALITLCTGLVITTEMLNTAIEYLVNLVSPDYNRLAGKIKDLSAGAVLVASVTAAITGLIIFVPKIVGRFL